MFHIILLIAYILPNIYIFISLRKHFINEQHRKKFSILYASLVIILPCIEYLSHSDNSPLISEMTKVGYYALPYLLYLFLTLLIVDLLRMINRFAKAIPVSVIKSSMFRNTLFAITMAVPFLIVIIGAYRHGIIQISSYKIEIPQKMSNLNHLKIAVAADLHLRGIKDQNIVDRFVAKINSEKPDIVFLVGDIIEGDRQDTKMKSLEESLREIHTKYGTYASLGNHESHGDNTKLDFFNNSAITVLQDSFVEIDKSFYVVGRNDSRYESRKTIEDLLKGVPKDLPIIMLNHRPVDFGIVSSNNVDIQFSGHSHNGQLFPINYITSYLYELSWGHKKVKNTHFFVTSGLQSWGPAVKTVGASEIMVIDIDFK
jgi:predicted MPP superfamily phosphohydrolase